MAPFFTGIAGSLNGQGGFGFGKRRRRQIFTKYLIFTSPGSVNMSQYGEIFDVNILSVSPGGTGSSGEPGVSYSRGGAGGTGGSSGRFTAFINSPFSPLTITIGNTYPTQVSGPLGPPSYGTHTIPTSISNTFNAYIITSGPSGANNSPGGSTYVGGNGGPGSGGFIFTLSNPSPQFIVAPTISPINASNGSPGGPAPSNPSRLGGSGGLGGQGYGAGGGGGGGGAEDVGNVGGGGGGGSGSSGIIIVKIEHY